MKAFFDTGKITGKRPRLCLIPDSTSDAALLEELNSKYVIAGMGRHPETGAMLHLELPLEEA